MDGQSYLNEISMANRPAPKSKMDFMKSKFFIVGAIGVVGLILLLIIGAVLGGGSSVKDQTITLKVRLDNTAALVGDYQPSIKSSILRSSSASLYSVMTNTSRELGEYLGEEKVPAKITEDEDAHKEALSSELFEAKINGVLDRTFTYKMVYEISLITTMERRIANSAKSDDLKNILETSLESLDNIYNALNNFSETTK
ncbi:hypothetical protein IKW73_01145 [Candidatus Saccharibacteria bacterium]|nr:hypothetical protein [Candidatus Saccharibacteria bacterium]